MGQENVGGPWLVKLTWVSKLGCSPIPQHPLHLPSTAPWSRTSVLLAYKHLSKSCSNVSPTLMMMSFSSLTGCSSPVHFPASFSLLS